MDDILESASDGEARKIKAVVEVRTECDGNFCAAQCPFLKVTDDDSWNCKIFGPLKDFEAEGFIEAERSRQCMLAELVEADAAGV